MMFFDTKTADEAIQQGNYHLSKLSGNPEIDNLMPLFGGKNDKKRKQL
jgi:hypothetical protein